MSAAKEFIQAHLPSGKSSSTKETVFKGYGIKDHAKWSDFEIMEYQPKNWTEDDVEIAITHCGVCGSDVHTITSGWGGADLPVVPGHEIIGHAVRVGKNVAGIQPGDRVGVGAQIWSCMDCRACKTDNENYCPKQVDTYNAYYPDGVKAQGGYSTAIRAHQQFVFPIPAELASEKAASMLCAGLTVYSPLVRNGAGPGKKVGIVGIGGLGHYAVMFAKALGAEVYAFTHSKSKMDDLKKMGVDHIVDVGDEDFEKPLSQALDLIISTRDVAEGFDLPKYLSMLWIHGSFISVGLPDTHFPSLSPFTFNPNGSKLGGSHIGSKKEALEMLDLAAKRKDVVDPWIETMPMSKASEAVRGVKDGKVRYRYVLVQDLVRGEGN
ncbi:NADPH-dependent alcohol dehydrogenase [Clavulina sp. PMI_390]|nr:NADPH-dependent alcohol dehydrogenase [Clavulina sp. PMI_390]